MCVCVCICVYNDVKHIYFIVYIYFNSTIKEMKDQNSILKIYGKIIDMPIKPITDLMRKGERASKEISMVFRKLSEIQHIMKKYVQLEFLFLYFILFYRERMQT